LGDQHITHARERARLLANLGRHLVRGVEVHAAYLDV
jgi:hypothetical protein